MTTSIATDMEHLKAAGLSTIACGLGPHPDMAAARVSHDQLCDLADLIVEKIAAHPHLSGDARAGFLREIEMATKMAALPIILHKQGAAPRDWKPKLKI